MPDNSYLYDKGSPSIEEMRHMVRRPDANSLEFYPLVTVERKCSKCGTTKPEWWIIINGERTCCRCNEVLTKPGSVKLLD